MKEVSKTYKCRKCEFETKNKSLIANHYKSNHSITGEFKCSTCNKIFNKISGLKHHSNTCKKIIENDNSYKITGICPKCGYYIKSSRDRHLNFCNGLGTRRFQIKSGNFYKTKKGSKEFGNKISISLKKYYEENPKDKLRLAETRKKILENGGEFLTTESRKIMSDKAKNNIKIRYKNGLEVKCGRAKKYTYFSEVAGEVKLDGTWELKYAKYLDSQKVIWKRNKIRFDYINLSGNKATYCPDFWVEDWNTYIEIKGYERDTDHCKWSQFKEPLKILRRKDLVDLGVLDIKIEY
jgi:DNA-directed RNA polymerase subunit RPC12/RpoP